MIILKIHDFVESSLTPKNEKKYGSHPTQKPEKIIQHFVELLSEENETILDPFMGSGTTGVVSRRLNRNFIGIELNTPSSGRFTHPILNRCITVREAARIQSFPDDFVFYGSKNSQMKQVGNAVPPKLGKAIAEEILKHL